MNRHAVRASEGKPPKKVVCGDECKAEIRDDEMGGVWNRSVPTEKQGKRKKEKKKAGTRGNGESFERKSNKR